MGSKRDPDRQWAYRGIGERLTPLRPQPPLTDRPITSHSPLAFVFATPHLRWTVTDRVWSHSGFSPSQGPIPWYFPQIDVRYCHWRRDAILGKARDAKKKERKKKTEEKRSWTDKKWKRDGCTGGKSCIIAPPVDSRNNGSCSQTKPIIINQTQPLTYASPFQSLSPLLSPPPPPCQSLDFPCFPCFVFHSLIVSLWTAGGPGWGH